MGLNAKYCTLSFCSTIFNAVLTLNYLEFDCCSFYSNFMDDEAAQKREKKNSLPFHHCNQTRVDSQHFLTAFIWHTLILIQRRRIKKIKKQKIDKKVKKYGKNSPTRGKKLGVREFSSKPLRSASHNISAG